MQKIGDSGNYPLRGFAKDSASYYRSKFLGKTGTYGDFSMEVLEHSVISGLVLIVYALIDKVIVPLIKSRKPKSDGSNGHSNGRQKDGIQTHLNSEFDRRISKTEDDLHKLSETMQEIRTEVAVSSEILKRIEGQ